MCETKEKPWSIGSNKPAATGGSTALDNVNTRMFWILVNKEIARFTEYHNQLAELDPPIPTTSEDYLESLAEYLGNVLRDTGAKVERQNFTGGILVKYRKGTLTYNFEE